MKSSSIVTRSLACVLALMLVIGNFAGIMPVGKAEDAPNLISQNAISSISITNSQILSHAKKLLGSQYVKGYCLQWVNRCFWMPLGAPFSETCCANTHGNSRIISTQRDNIPIGANVYFDGGTTLCSVGHIAGHVGVYIGNGHVINLIHYNNDPAKFSYVRDNTIDQILSWPTHYIYRGWGYPDGVNLIDSNPITSATLEFKEVTYPKVFKVNTTYGWSLTSGLLQSNVQLQSIRSQILTSSGNAVSDSGTKAISGYYYPVVSLDDFSGTDNGVRFSFIKNPGQYTWRLIATDISGRSITLDMPITAVASGSTSTATASKSYSADATISSVKLNKSSLTLESGKSATLTATVSPSKATNKSVTWSSSNTAVATVSNGVVKAVGAGTATITCTSVANNSKKATCTVTVNPAASEITGWVYKVNSSLTMRKDASTFSGRVTSIKKGTTITVTRKAKSLAYTWGYCSLNGKSGWVVVDNRWTTLQKMLTTKVAGVSLNNTYLSLKPGSSATLYANVSPSDAPNRNVTWSSSNTSVATVSNGVVKAVGAGTATITCTSAADSSKKATCTITVSSSASTGDNTAKWVYRVQTSYGLNMRSGAGTGYGIVTTLYSPTTITVTRKATANGYTWGYGTSSNGCTGWIVVDNNWTGLVS